VEIGQSNGGENQRNRSEPPYLDRNFRDPDENLEKKNSASRGSEMSHPRSSAARARSSTPRERRWPPAAGRRRHCLMASVWALVGRGGAGLLAVLGGAPLEPRLSGVAYLPWRAQRTPRATPKRCCLLALEGARQAERPASTMTGCPKRQGCSCCNDCFVSNIP
jgi:hypothetical protein